MIDISQMGIRVTIRFRCCHWNNKVNSWANFSVNCNLTFEINFVRQHITVPLFTKAVSELSNDHYSDVPWAVQTSRITDKSTACFIDCSDWYKRKRKNLGITGSLWGESSTTIGSTHEWSVTWKAFPYHDFTIIPTGHSTAHSITYSDN